MKLFRIWKDASDFEAENIGAAFLGEMSSLETLEFCVRNPDRWIQITGCWLDGSRELVGRLRFSKGQWCVYLMPRSCEDHLLCWLSRTRSIEMKSPKANSILSMLSSGWEETTFRVQFLEPFPGSLLRLPLKAFKRALKWLRQHRPGRSIPTS